MEHTNADEPHENTNKRTNIKNRHTTPEKHGNPHEHEFSHTGELQKVLILPDGVASESWNMWTFGSLVVGGGPTSFDG